MTQTFDRSQLDGKDREQLSQIATALGVKSISRMRKAELVDAIVQAGGSGSPGGSPGPRKVRSARASEVGGGDLAALAAEEDSLAGSGGGDEMALIRPRRRPAGEG